MASLYERFQDYLQLSGESSNFVYESVEECNIHFHKRDLRRVASFIKTPEWLKPKTAPIKPQNINDLYFFMYAVTIALFNKEVYKNPGRIIQNLRLYIDIFSWHHIDFPAS